MKGRLSVRERKLLTSGGGNMSKLDEARKALTSSLTAAQCELVIVYIDALAEELRKKSND